MQGSFSRRDEPPRRPRAVHVQRVGPIDRIKVLVLSPKVQGYEFHWDPKGKRTMPCHGPAEVCPYHPLPKRWYGFLYCLLKPEDKPVFLQLTDYAVTNLSHATKQYTSLRGLILEVSRERPHKQAPLTAIVLTDMHVGKPNLPPDVNVEPSLANVFRWNNC